MVLFIPFFFNAMVMEQGFDNLNENNSLACVISRLMIKEYRQCTYNVTLRRIRKIIFAVEKQ